MRHTCTAVRRQALSTRQLPTSTPETEEWGLFPREREGNEYKVNWSLTYDGIVSTGDAFHNARLPVLATRLPNKISGGKVEASGPEYYGDVSTLEAGESIPFTDFESAFSAHKEYFSRGADLLVEDHGLGSYGPFRLGTRIVTDDAATALIFRNLLLKTPPREVDHRARFNGWNFDERWNVPDFVWDGVKYDVAAPTTPLPGQRPILATVGGSVLDGKSTAVQFVEVNNALVGKFVHLICVLLQIFKYKFVDHGRCQRDRCQNCFDLRPRGRYRTRLRRNSERAGPRGSCVGVSVVSEGE